VTVVSDAVKRTAGFLAEEETEADSTVHELGEGHEKPEMGRKGRSATFSVYPIAST
jgi:hypothetical protein